MQISKASTAMLLGVALMGTSGCKGVDRFDTGTTGAFCGDMVNGVTAEGLVPDDADATGLKLKLALTLDTHHLSDFPGALSSNDDTNGLCAGPRLFDKARVRTVKPALHDAISGVQITQDHDQDVFTWVDSACQGTFVAILSLMTDGKVEVRLFKPMKEADAGATANLRTGFGLFSLTRNENGCGF